MPLGRSNYSALDGVMPYIFLVAILMIMPEGIGDAYEKWKIERLRKRKTENSEKSPTIEAALAIMPTGIFGLHHWYRHRSHRMQSFSAIAIASYVFHKFSGFVERNSFADGGCADSCASSGVYENNLAVLTGRNDGTLLLEDSPLTEDDLLNQMSAPSEMSPFEAEQWLSGAVQDMHESWLNMMNFEIELVNFIVNLGDLMWPTAIILLWIYSIYEGIGVLYDRDTESGPLNDAMDSLQKIQSSISESIASAKLTFTTKWSEFDRRHNTVINKKKEQLNEKLARLYSASSDVRHSFLSAITRGSPERNRKLEMYGRESSLGSWIAFSIFMTILLIFLIWLPIAESDDFRWKKVLQVSNVLITLSIFVLMSFSLNLHTGYTGMVNFGIIFFVAIGTITVGILTAPKELHGYGWGYCPLL